MRLSGTAKSFEFKCELARPQVTFHTQCFSDRLRVAGTRICNRPHIPKRNRPVLGKRLPVESLDLALPF